MKCFKRHQYIVTIEVPVDYDANPPYANDLEHTLKNECVDRLEIDDFCVIVSDHEDTSGWQRDGV